MNEYVLSAFLFGVTAGINPGPLSIVVIQQTLQNGLQSGLKASFAPIITDGPIIAASLFLLTQFKDIDTFIGVLSLIGSLYLFHLAFKIISLKKTSFTKADSETNSLPTAIKVNFLNPNPYLFWFTVGGTYIVLGTLFQSIVFVIVGISTLVISKMLIAFIASKFRNVLNSNIYLFIMRFFGIGMALFGISFLNKSYNVLLVKLF